MSDTTYNGWTNYPTWNVKLWLDNEQSDYQFVKWTYEKAQEEVKSDPFDWESKEQAMRYHFSEMLQEAIESQSRDEVSGASMFTDIMGWALGQVDWREIAQAYIEEFEHDA